jgi:hypothetical protein
MLNFLSWLILGIDFSSLIKLDKNSLKIDKQKKSLNETCLNFIWGLHNRYKDHTNGILQWEERLGSTPVTEQAK